MKLYPISFSIPESKIVDLIPSKIKVLSNIIPGQSYTYNEESEYYNEYKSSIFAITTKKGGWDCMRHYEILANGCIPVFPNIEQCPPNTMTFLPKEWLYQANILYENSKNKSINDIEYRDLALKFLEYAKTHLTTTHMAKYILRMTGNQDKRTILYLSGNTEPDYLRCITLHGFKTLFGSECHDYPKIKHIYKDDTINYKFLYGKGFTYSNNLTQDFRNNNLDSTIEEDIRNKRYDLIIYGSFHRGMPFYDLVMQHYNPNNVILMCGEDLHSCTYHQYEKHPIFVREL